MSDSDDVKKQIKKQDKEVYGDDIVNTSEANTDEMYERMVGHKPRKGETIADEVEESEEARKKSEV